MLIKQKACSEYHPAQLRTNALCGAVIPDQHQADSAAPIKANVGPFVRDRCHIFYADLFEVPSNNKRRFPCVRLALTLIHAATENAFIPGSILCFYCKCKSLKINEINPYLLSPFLSQIIGYQRILWNCMHCRRGGENTARKNRKANNGGKNDSHHESRTGRIRTWHTLLSGGTHAQFPADFGTQPHKSMLLYTAHHPRGIAKRPVRNPLADRAKSAALNQNPRLQSAISKCKICTLKDVDEHRPLGFP